MRLTTWLVDQRTNEADEPTLTSEIVDRSCEMAWLTPSVRRDRLLLYVAKCCPRLDDQLAYQGTPESPAHMTNQELLALTECFRPKELYRLIEFSAQWLKADPPHLRVTFDGWQRVNELQSTKTASEQAFVAMWFDPSMAEIFDRGIEPGVKSAGYKALRIDRKEHNNKIDDEIIAEIRRSRFVVADFTCGIMLRGKTQHALPRGGVYYEAGFAHGLGLPVIFTCRADAITYVHFDTRQFAHVIWETADDLKEKLSNRISATVGDGPLRNQAYAD